MDYKIFGYKCKKCGHLHYPYRMVCKNCGKNEHNEFDQIELSARGKLLTFTFVHNLPADFNVAQLGLGIVELENGLKMTGQIEIENPQIGMDVFGDVQVVRRDEFKEHMGIVFKSQQ